MNTQLQEKLADLPLSPGIYMYRADDGEIVYVGKAARLRSRVRQYFQSSRLQDTKTDALVAEIADVEWIETESEIDALFLESEMVKRYMPRYNVLLRDDKSETFVRVDMKSPWPTVTLTRTPGDDGAEYIGPFYNSYPVRKALRYLRRAFPYFTKPPKDSDSRLEQQIGLVPRRGGEQAMREYKANLRQLIRYIKGERKSLVRQLESDMKKAAKEQNFEEAARLRNQLHHMNELQRRVMFGDSEHLDIAKDVALSDLAQLLAIDEPLKRIECIDVSHHSGDAVVAALVVFVNGASSRSDYRKFRLSDRNDDYANIASVITRRFSVKNLQQWPKPQLLIVDGGKGQLSSALGAVKALGIDLPIVGIAKNEEVIIAPASAMNDYLARGEERDEIDLVTESDYVSINLHPGQINAGGHSRNLRAGTKVHRYSEVTKLIQRIRDESHRFAISYHHTVSGRSVQSSKLMDIPGVGSATQRKLLKALGSLRGVKLASEAELTVVVGKKKANAIKAHLGDAT